MTRNEVLLLMSEGKELVWYEGLRMPSQARRPPKNRWEIDDQTVNQTTGAYLKTEKLIQIKRSRDAIRRTVYYELSDAGHTVVEGIKKAAL